MSVSKKIPLLLIPLALVEILMRVAGIGESLVYIEDPDVGYLPAPSQTFSTMGHPVNILDQGFRAPSATNKLLFVGDSVTYGTAFLRDEETFSANLGGANAGVNGWGIQNIAAYIKQTPLESYDTVVWTLPSCDTLRSFMTLRNGLISLNRPMILRLEYVWRFIWYGFLFPTPVNPDPANYETNLACLLEAARHVEQQGKKILFVLLPYREEAMGGHLPETPYFAKMKEAIRAANLWFIEATPTSDIEAMFRDPAHLSVKGNQWLADIIHLELTEGQAGTRIVP